MSPRTDIVAEIDLNKLRQNVRNIREYIQPAQIIGVVKANAYGHGCIPVAKVLAEEGISLLAVIAVEEAIELRDAGVATDILIMGKVWEHQLDALHEYNLQPILASEDDYDRFSAFTEQADQSLRVHLKIDTGMGRMGILYDDYEAVFHKIINHPRLRLNGVMSHFATADDADELARVQAERFRHIHNHVSKTMQDNAPMFHLSNSAGMLYLDNENYDGIRLGLSLYGITPSSTLNSPIELSQVMSLKSSVTYIKKYPKDFPIGYGSAFRTKDDSTILVCSGGYEDGIPRRYGNRGKVLIHGKRFPVVGNVSMDTFTVDVGSKPVSVGDEVVLLGEQGNELISVWEMANKLNIIPYEVTCGISPRVTRTYLET